MTDTKISQLPELVTPASGDLLPIVHAGVTYKIQEQNLATPQVNADWSAVSGIAQILNKPASFPPLPHDMITSHTYTGGANLDVFGLSAASVIAKLTPSSNPGAAAAILATDTSGAITLRSMILSGRTDLETLTLKAGTFVQATGTVTVAGGSSTVTGTGTLFTSELMIGDFVYFGSIGISTPRVVTAIASNTSLTVNGACPATTNDTFFYVHPVLRVNDYAGVTQFIIGGNGMVGFTATPAQVGIDFGTGGINFGTNTSITFPGTLSFFSYTGAPTNESKWWINGANMAIEDQASGGYLAIRTTMASTYITIQTQSVERLRIDDSGILTHAAVNATTNVIDNVLSLSHGSSGTPAAGFGEGLRFGLQSSTTVNQDAARLTASWVVATHASRTARLALLASDSAGEREGMRIEASGTAPLVSFYGANAVARATTGGTAAAFVANTSGIANDTATWGGYTVGQVVKALQNIGILT